MTLLTDLENATEGSRLRKRILVDPESSCWLWHGGLDKRGRGRIWVNGRPRLAHREVWRFFHGPIQNGKLLCHHCDNPQCVRPDHLYVGTQKDNTRDMAERGRHRAALYPEQAREIGRRSGLQNTWAKGEGCPTAKLTEQQVRWIRADPRPTRYLVADYKVARSTIQKIRRGETWSHVRAIEAEKEKTASHG